MEDYPIAEELCTRSNIKKFKGEVTYTESQLRQFGLIVEDAEKNKSHYNF